MNIEDFNGCEQYCPEPGDVETWHCGVCGNVGIVNRNINGPTGWAEAMAGHGHPHDYFFCPHRETEWHKQAKDILFERNKNPSKRVKALYEQDWQDILKEHKAEIET